ncbi:MAG: HAD family hydrolase [Bacilli bacterium]
MTENYYQAFVFDMDGTILDTIIDLEESVNQALISYGLKARTKEEIISFIGNGSDKLIRRAIGKENENLFSVVFDSYYNYYSLHFSDKTTAYPGIIEALKYAKSRGIKLFVYTNKPDAVAKKLADKCFGKNFFEKIIGIPLGGVIKPDPKAYLDAIKDYHFSLDRQAYFGDSTTDIETSYNIGIKNMYSVSWGYRSIECLKNFKLKPKAIINNAYEIMDVVNSLK